MLVKIRKAIGTVINGVEKRPWIPMVVYLGCFALFVLASGLLIVDMVDSRWRPFSGFTKSEKAGICHVGDYIGWAAVCAAGFSVVVVPFVMLCAGRFRAAFNVVVMGIAGVGASVLFMFVTGPLWFVIGLEEAQATDAFGDKGATMTDYKDYSEASSDRDLRKILPPEAKDITVLRKLYFQGHSVGCRCRIPEEALRRFTVKRKLVFQEYDLTDGRYGWSFQWHKEKDPLFSQFPKVHHHEVVDHHQDGYFSCVANDRTGGGNVNEDTLLYFYDAKCSILWVQSWR